MDENMNQQAQPQPQPAQQQPTPQPQPVQQPGGYRTQPGQPGGYYPQAPAAYRAPKQRKIAVVLGFFLGSLGIHKFYMGKTVPGIIALLVTLLGSIFTFGIAAVVMAVIAEIEVLFYLCMSDEEWQNAYIIGDRQWF